MLFTICITFSVTNYGKHTTVQHKSTSDKTSPFPSKNPMLPLHSAKTKNTQHYPLTLIIVLVQTVLTKKYQLTLLIQGHLVRKHDKFKICKNVPSYAFVPRDITCFGAGGGFPPVNRSPLHQPPVQPVITEIPSGRDTLGGNDNAVQLSVHSTFSTTWIKHAACCVCVYFVSAASTYIWMNNDFKNTNCMRISHIPVELGLPEKAGSPSCRL